MRNRDIETTALLAVVLAGGLGLFLVTAVAARPVGWGTSVRPDDSTLLRHQRERDRLHPPPDWSAP